MLAGFLGVLSISLIASSVHAAPNPNPEVVITTPHMPTLLRVNSSESARGYEKSSYRGRWFDKRYESVRKCIGMRESHFTYAMGSNGGPNLGGTYQFMASDRWPVSLSWMMKKETRRVFGAAEANRMQRVLSHHQVGEWSRYWQDFAFWRVWRHGAGRAHWNPIVPGTGCF